MDTVHDFINNFFNEPEVKGVVFVEGETRIVHLKNQSDSWLVRVAEGSLADLEAIALNSPYPIEYVYYRFGTDCLFIHFMGADRYFFTLMNAQVFQILSPRPLILARHIDNFRKFLA